MFSSPVFVRTQCNPGGLRSHLLCCTYVQQGLLSLSLLAAAGSRLHHHGNSVSCSIGSVVPSLEVVFLYSLLKVLISSGTSSSFGEYMMGLLCIDDIRQHINHPILRILHRSPLTCVACLACPYLVITTFP